MSKKYQIDDRVLVCTARVLFIGGVLHCAKVLDVSESGWNILVRYESRVLGILYRPKEWVNDEDVFGKLAAPSEPPTGSILKTETGDTTCR